MPGTTFTTVIDGLRVSARVHANRPAFLGPDAMDYAALYRQVRHYASRFAGARLGRGERVAIWAPKSGAFVTAIYAAMELGGVYAPLDGAQPVERARKILAGAEPAVLVTDRERYATLNGALPPSVRLVLLLDGGERDLPAAPEGVELDAAEPLNRELVGDFVPPEPMSVGPDDIAAILFTSGSTGMPKGVQISYRNLHAFIGWAVAEFQLTQDDVLTNHAGFHFDLSTFDLFAASAAGAAVWIIREGEQRDVGALADGIRRHGVTTIYCVPSLLTMIASSKALTPEITASLKRVLFAGEVFPIKHLRALAGQLPAECALYNLYGPTETNVCTFHRVRPEDLESTRPVALGLPLPGQEALLLDENGDPIEEEGEIGELVMAGGCVTPGYFNRFDPANHDNHGIGRHATGDLVTREGGLLYYCGRKDRMLKINGNRVELGEIEAALSSMSAIHEAAVIAVIGETAQTLIAFFSSRAGDARPGVLEIKRHCSKLLPRYMIPNVIRGMDSLPKNSNGKIDYLALRHTAEAAVAVPAAPQPEPAVAD
jgi:amino acid adenylation domain-containing protein